jgi:hypothetical protein
MVAMTLQKNNEPVRENSIQRDCNHAGVARSFGLKKALEEGCKAILKRLG